MRPREHPFACRWNHSTHYFPTLASRIPADAVRVLDIGCGDGTFCRFVDTGERVVVGADIDATVIPMSSTRTRYVVTTAEALPFRNDTFSAVTISMVLHHVDGERALAEAVRVLVPGGVLLVLGYGAYGGWRDAPYELRDLVVHRWTVRQMHPWEPPTVKAAPSQSWREVRAMARQALPGCTFRRLAMWRYLVEWRKPGSR